MLTTLNHNARIHQQLLVSIFTLADNSWPIKMVENTGLEPVTSGLQSRRSPN